MLLLAVENGSEADPAASPPVVPWSDWVGEWQGKLKWDSCTGDGEPRATIHVDAADGVLIVDLAPAGSALPALTLVDDKGGLAGTRGDVSARLDRKKDTLDLAVSLESGCEVHGSLTRSSVGIASCDRLAGWARIEAQCTKLSKPPLENPARVARQRAEWTKATADARTKLAAQCTARASKLETALIDAGCAPHPDPAIGLRGAECQALRTSNARLARYTSVPYDMRQAIERDVVVVVAAAQGADQASMPFVEAKCKSVREELNAIALQAGCPP